MEIQPLGCCFVFRLRLLVASVPGSTAGSHNGACLTLCQVICCSSASGAESKCWRPGALCWSPVRYTLRLLKTSRSSSDSRLLMGFSPSHCWSLLGGTSACSGPLLRMTAISLAFGLATAVFRCGGGFTRGYGWSPVFPSFGNGRRRRLVPLMLCASTGNSFWSILASSRLSFVWDFSGLVQVFSCLALSVPVGVRSIFSPAGFSSLWLCLVERI